MLTACGFKVRRLRETPALFGFWSSQFDRLPERDVYIKGTKVVAHLAALLQIHQPGLDTTMAVTGTVNVGGALATSAPFSISIRGTDGLKRLAATQSGEAALIVQLMELAGSKEDVSHLLSQISGRPPTWADLYDIMEFFGMQNGIASRGWADTAEVRRHIQTAGRFRHPAVPKPLPPSPPTIEESREFVFGLVRRWLAELR